MTDRDRSKLNFIAGAAKIADMCWRETQTRAELAPRDDDLAYWIGRAATFEAAAKLLGGSIERIAEEARRED